MSSESELPATDNFEFALESEAADSSSTLPQGVEVRTDWAAGRQRQISARIQIPHPIDQVWQVLTDYERLADFIPSLSKSCRLEHPQGGIRIEQVGSQSLFRLKFCARVVLDMIEKVPHHISFQMVEGDFKTFSGSWQLHSVTLDSQPGTDLHYSVLILPPRTMPIGMIERRLSHTLAANLTAIRERVDALFGSANFRE